MTLRRAILGGLGVAALLGPAVFSGCATNFTPEGKVETLRVIGVTLDHPYVPDNSDNPDHPEEWVKPADCPADAEHCTVHFNMEVYDAYGVNNLGAERKINILWIGGCFNPEGDQYSLCLLPLLGLYQQAAPALAEAVKSHTIPEFPKGLPLGWGKKFTLEVPDIVSSRPKSTLGPRYGLGYVFFLACAGDFDIIDSDPSAAGNFPIGCFDSVTHEPLGAESFVPGYTQVYSFEDARYNKNPEVVSLTLEGPDATEAASISEEDDEIPTVPPCDVPSDERYLPPSCTRQDAFDRCPTYEVDVAFPESQKGAVDASKVAEIDPDAKGEHGEQLSESVWVDYFSDTGDFDSDIKLINDSQTGYQTEHSVRWIPPPEPGLSTIWAVVRDARGGSSVKVGFVRVK